MLLMMRMLMAETGPTNNMYSPSMKESVFFMRTENRFFTKPKITVTTRRTIRT